MTKTSKPNYRHMIMSELLKTPLRKNIQKSSLKSNIRRQAMRKNKSMIVFDYNFNKSLKKLSEMKILRISGRKVKPLRRTSLEGSDAAVKKQLKSPRRLALRKRRSVMNLRLRSN